MVKINLMVRELGGLEPDFSLDFELPEVPAVGSYISIQRPEHEAEWGEDVIVRKVWWRLKHPEMAAHASNPPKLGTVHEIFVECDVATSRWSSDRWLKSAEAARARGVNVEAFEVARLNVREGDLKSYQKRKGRRIPRRPSCIPMTFDQTALVTSCW
jgi:hypothetical protein